MGNYEEIKRFGEKLHTLRQQHGMTVIELGDMLGVGNSFVVRIEKGQRKPPTGFILGVSRIFDVPIDLLMKDELDLE
ncbi:helix-turn-helix transcriptional regulator [Anaerolineales bacterium HSG25]|nr:helix-turn-helix transcriptional regulator [Anaerolineales bacterium HSG25]